MEKKQKIEIIIAAVIIIALIVLVLVLLFSGKDKVDDGSDMVDDGGQTDVMDETPVEDEFAVLPHSVARSFVERFGSFSSQSDYSNVEDVKSLATSDLQARLDDIAKAARNDLVQTYYGVSTQVVIIEVTEQTDTSATLTITTQREESIDSPANTSIRYQDIVLDMIWDGEKWMIDDFAWQE